MNFPETLGIPVEIHVRSAPGSALILSISPAQGKGQRDTTSPLSTITKAGIIPGSL